MADADSKACTGCGLTLPLSSFAFRTARGQYFTRCRECMAKADRARYWRDPEKARKAQRDYNDAHREAIRATVNRSYRKHIEQRLIDSRERLKRIRLSPELSERRRELHKAWRLRNREAVLTKQKAWRAKNKDKVRDSFRRTYALRRGKLKTGISTKEFRKWRAAAKKVCYWCGKKCAKKFEVDHYIPLAAGGTHEISNFVIACRSCNARKHTKHPEQFRAETWHGTLFSNLVGK